MISVIICSINPELLFNIRKNINDTIGVPHEILYFDNRGEKKGLCYVYNQLAEKASFSYLCFLHEDVIFSTKNWGSTIADIFIDNSNVGLIGIAGSKYKSAYYSGWFSGMKELDCANYSHQYIDGLEKVFLSPKKIANLQEVVCVDGVFFCCLKDSWRNTLFDDALLKGFHFYDIDFSLRIAHHSKVVITYDIELTHVTSGGDYGDRWVETAMLYHEKMKTHLPFSKTNVNKKAADKRIIITTLDFLKNYKISFHNKIKWIFLQKLYFSPVYYYSILKFIFYRPLRVKHIHGYFKKTNTINNKEKI